MGIGINNVSSVVGNYQVSSVADTKKDSKDNAISENATGVVYEKEEETVPVKSYTINKMTQEERNSLISKMKEDLNQRQQQLQSIVSQMLGQQATTYGIANSTDDIWKFLAEGNFTVDEAAKAQAQKDIAEDGYFGVKQTSERLFDFASALAGDDVERMKKMQEAMHKGFEDATGVWGKELPEISKDTIKAADQLFEEYYHSKSAIQN